MNSQARISSPMALLLLSAVCTSVLAQDEDRPLRDYFRAEVKRIEANPLLGIDSAEKWKEQRPELQRQMREMLGLDPLPERTDLQVEITGTVDRPDFVVEKILYQSSPGLYVTGNLYRPKEVEGKLPAILYVCGHAKVERDGVIYGNKAHYQHHAAWYASNGYVCLVVDTLQLGEVPGLHHGTHREGRWWWHSRGYTPAGIEVWNGIRAIDYLVSRPEVDPDRIGVTGRSGGGGVSWYLGAVDDRLAAVIPVAGITDMRNHIIEGFEGRLEQGVIEGHCDCMYMFNTYRWDFDTVAALVAPKPLLFENTDSDNIFPEDGVRRIYSRLEKVYEWYDEGDRLGLVIGEGGHADTEEIRHPSFAFMDRWLQNKDTQPEDIEEPDRKIPVEDLKVLEVGQELADQRNDRIDEEFVPKAEEPPAPDSAEAWEELRDRWMRELREKVFRAWPEKGQAGLLDLTIAFEREDEEWARKWRAIDYTSQPGVQLRAYVTWPAHHEIPAHPALVIVVGEDIWEKVSPWIDLMEGRADEDQREALKQRAAKAQEKQEEYLREDPFLTMLGVASLVEAGTVALVVPRGVGPTAWEDGHVDTHTRRRFALLGQTLDGMRVWDVRRGLKALVASGDWISKASDGHHFELSGWGDSAALALWATVFEPELSVSFLTMVDSPATVRDGPAFLNLERVLGMPQAVTLPAPRGVSIAVEDPEAFSWAAEAGRLLERQDSGRKINIGPSH